MFSQLLQIASLALPLALASPHGQGHAGRHHDLAKRVAGDVQVHDFGKRFSGSRWTFYSTGLGACGKVNKDSDFIVALNTPQYGGGYPGPNCFKMITMKYNGKTTQAQITDQCPGCPYGGLDLSPGLFKFFDSPDKGVLTGEWEFSDGSGGGGDDKPKEPEKPKETPKPSPTPKKEETEKEPEPTTSHKPSSSSSSSTKASSSPASSSSSVASSSSSGSAAPTGNLDSFRQVVIGLGEMLVAGYRS